MKTINGVIALTLSFNDVDYDDMFGIMDAIENIFTESVEDGTGDFEDRVAAANLHDVFGVQVIVSDGTVVYDDDDEEEEEDDEEEE